MLRRHLDGASTLAAAEALIALGAPATEFTDPLLHWLPTCHRYDETVRVCREVLDPSAAPRLRELTDSNERTIRALTNLSAQIWEDEQQRDAILQTLNPPQPTNR
jgi:hypothetical protein